MGRSLRCEFIGATAEFLTGVCDKSFWIIGYHWSFGNCLRRTPKVSPRFVFGNESENLRECRRDLHFGNALEIL